jgi:hypothetical protein
MLYIMGKCYSKNQNDYINECIQYLFHAEYIIQICSTPQDIRQICHYYLLFRRLELMEKFMKNNYIVWKNAGVKSGKDIRQIYLLLTQLYVDLTTVYILARRNRTPITDQMIQDRVTELQINATKSHESIGEFINNIKKDMYT